MVDFCPKSDFMTENYQENDFLKLDKIFILTEQ